MADPAPTQTRQFTVQESLTVWQTLAERRTSYDAMMWQTPALGMTAQAFLLTLALANDTSGLARIVSATLSAVISVMVLQLLAKHRKNEMLETLTLEALESRLGFPGATGIHPHSHRRHTPEQLETAGRAGRSVLFGPRRFWNMSSFSLWCYGQYLFILIAVGIIAVVALGVGRILNS